MRVRGAKGFLEGKPAAMPGNRSVQRLNGMGFDAKLRYSLLPSVKSGKYRETEGEKDYSSGGGSKVVLDEPQGTHTWTNGRLIAYTPATFATYSQLDTRLWYVRDPETGKYDAFSDFYGSNYKVYHYVSGSNSQARLTVQAPGSEFSENYGNRAWAYFNISGTTGTEDYVYALVHK